MIYTARHSDVEVAFVSLAGSNLAVVAIDGKAHAMPADVFLSLYEERQTAPEPEPETPRRREEKQQVAKALKPKRSGTRPVDGHPSQQQADMHRLLTEFGPLTTAEVMGRTKAEYGATMFILSAMRKARHCGAHRTQRPRQVAGGEAMTPYQRGLARHALGLRKGQCVSYRNRYFAYEGNADFQAWIGMVIQGLAHHEGPSNFYLTYNGALLALDKGEALDVEDFPEAKVVKP